jgi:hypothetical protein
MSHKPAGGPRSKNIVEPRVRTGTGSRSARPAGTAQIGIMYGDKATHGDPKGTRYTGERLHNDRTFQPVKFGNEVSLNVGKGGPGTGRTIYKTGTQCQTGPANPGNAPAKGKDILSSFGPDYKARS